MQGTSQMQAVGHVTLMVFNSLLGSFLTMNYRLAILSLKTVYVSTCISYMHVRECRLTHRDVRVGREAQGNIRQGG